MTKYRKISPCIWNDAKVRELSDKGKLALLFLLTHPHMTPLGAIRANVPGLAFELGWSAKVFRRAMDEIVSYDIAREDVRACLIWFPKFLKHNAPESPNVVRSWVGAFDDLPESPLTDAVIKGARDMVATLSEGFKQAFKEAFADVMGQAFAEGAAEAFPEGFGKALPQAMPNQEQEQEQEKEKEYSASAAPAAAPASCAPPVEEPMPEPAASPALPKAVQPAVVPKLAPPGGEPAYRTKKGRWLKGEGLRDFERFWRDFALTKGKAEAADAWLDIRGKTPELVARICDAARQEAAARAALEAKGQTPKWAQGWLTARRWEDYAPSSPALPSAARIAMPLPDIPDPTPEDLERTRRNALQWRDRLHGIAERGAA